MKRYIINLVLYSIVSLYETIYKIIRGITDIVFLLL